MEGIELNPDLPPLKAKTNLFSLQEAFHDLLAGIKKWRICLLLGWLDLRLRYRRSYLGPFWITISMAVMIYSMGFIYSHIFNLNLAEYFLYISGGMLAWVFLSTTMIEMMHCFVDASSFILQVKMPFSIYILRIMTRNFIVLSHNMLAVVPLLMFFKCMPNLLALFSGLLITALSMFSIGMLLAMMGARFRDASQVATSLLQVGFLLTPIMWKPSMLPEKASLALYLNPLYYYVEWIRSSVLNQTLHSAVLKGAIGIGCTSFLIMVLVFSKMRRRIPFWI